MVCDVLLSVAVTARPSAEETRSASAGGRQTEWVRIMTPDTYPLIPADARITAEPPMLIVDGLELSVTSVQADRLRQLTRGLTGRVPLSAMALSDEDAALLRQLREQGLLFDLRISADSVPTGQFCDYLHARIARWRTPQGPRQVAVAGRWQ